MSGPDLETVIQAGEQLFTVKLLLTSIQYLWVYDYLLNLGDELQYAWSGRKSWVFALFIGNRYSPLVHFIWVQFTMFHYEETFCRYTKWLPTLHTGTITTLAQIVIAIRVYAVTGMNPFLGGALAFVVVAQFITWVFSLIWIALGPLQPLPDVDLDVFKICLYKQWEAGEIVYYAMGMTFDVLAFSTIILTAMRPRMRGYPTIPGILNIIVRDSTRYFIFIFSGHILSLLFIYVTPADVRLLPAMANTIFVPVMASRLMLSLKKAGANEKGWTMDTMTTSSWGNDPIRFASQVPGGSPETPLASVEREEGGIELGVASQTPPRRRGSPGSR